MRLLVVEDDLLLQEVIEDYFTSKEWEVAVTDSGEEALEMIHTSQFQLAFLDVMLPGMNGFTLCRKLREVTDLPVVFITARVQEEDELNGYAMGADDYVTKPFSLPVLYAKAMALMSRVRGSRTTDILEVGPFSVDMKRHEICVRRQKVELAPIEYDLMVFLMENKNRIFSREQLLVRFWGYDFDGNERVVDNHIKKLRKALGTEGGCIETIRKTGYRLAVKE